jgi:hypothetical protein
MDDQVQKVSAIVSAGMSTTYGSSAGYITGYAGRFGVATGRQYQESSQQTLLSERLAPLPEPRLARAWTGQLVLLVVVLGLFACGSFTYITVTTDSPAAYLPCLAFALCWGGVGLWRWTVARRLRAEWQAAREHWQKLIALWGYRYYCHRDDVVFFPGVDVAVPVEEMWDITFGPREPETT